MANKTCTKCGINKDIELFPLHGKWRRNVCAECIRIRNREYKQTHKVEIRATFNKWRKLNPPKPRTKEQRQEYARRTKELRKQKAIAAFHAQRSAGWKRLIKNSIQSSYSF